MSNFSRGLLAATLTSSLAFAGATAASAEETATSCGSPKAEFTATVDGKEHTFKKVSEFVWQATDDEKVELNRAEIFDLAKDGEDVCDSEPIDIDEPDTDNDGGGSEDDETDGDDESDDNTGDDESEGGDDDADNDDESEGGDDDADNDDDDESEGDDDKNKDKSSFDGIKDALSSKDGKPTDLGIAAIVIGVLGALAAIVPNAARALGIKLPF
ncbi:hypothetical protein [Corynebacterium sp. HMSC074H12]|uniref:hypothetical protein n=1 Tax=Corynebacterium sp. HMSC074H12 TaxID=1739436 RepID=UPI0008D5791B|nr:hypothetical protein [Corynebacterium sp. HMSC074H12]OFQ55095.1 hypothetical protein HMPREF2932_11835 [Corynebacterium sp. HMSC074H12]